MLNKVEAKKHSHKTNGIKTNGIKVKTDSEIWDEQLADPNSPQLRILLKQLQIDIENGDIEEGGFDGL
jgi:hypothetical protein